MNSKDSAEKIWKVSFIIAVLAFGFFMIFKKLDLPLSEFTEDVFILTSFFGCAVFVQTNKTLIEKIVIIMVVLAFFSVVNTETIESEWGYCAVCPLLILLGIHNKDNPKIKKVVTVVLGLILAITIAILGYFIHEKSTENRAHGSGVVESVQRQYNAGFEEYNGQSKIKGANIKELIRNVMTHNRSVVKEDEDITELIQVRLGGPSDTPLEDAKRMVTNSNDSENLSIEDIEAYNENINNELSKIKNGWSYTLACGYDPETGYITDINVVQEEYKETTNTVNKSK